MKESNIMKQYSKPTITIQTVDLEGVVAGSSDLDIGSGEGNEQLSLRKDVWCEDNWIEEPFSEK